MKHIGINEYYVTREGRVLNANKGYRELVGCVGVHGHIRVELYDESFKPRNNGRRSKRYLVHRLVAKAFIGEIPDGYVVEHLDGDPSNNHVSNLKISTQSENIRTALTHGTFGKKRNSYVFRNRHSGERLVFNDRDDVFSHFDIFPTNKSVTSLFKHPRVYSEWFIEDGTTVKSLITDIVVEENGITTSFDSPKELFFYLFGDHRTSYTLSCFNKIGVVRKRNMKLIQYKRQQTIEKVSERTVSESN